MLTCSLSHSWYPVIDRHNGHLKLQLRDKSFVHPQHMTFQSRLGPNPPNPTHSWDPCARNWQGISELNFQFRWVPSKVTTETLVHFILNDISNAGTPFPSYVISGLEFVNSPLIVAEAFSFAVFTNVTFSTARKAPTHLVNSVSHPSMVVLLFSFNTTVLLGS